MKKDLCFVKANMDHIDVVFKWANDATTRKNAFNTNHIPYDEHVIWYTKKIEEPDTLFYICKEKESNIGQVRVEIEERNAVISYSVDKDFRGKGYGKQLLMFAEEVVRFRCNSEIKTINLIGKVKHSNIASQKCFLAEGYSKKVLDDYVEFTKEILYDNRDKM